MAPKFFAFLLLINLFFYCCQNKQKSDLAKNATTKSVADTVKKAPKMDFLGKNLVDLGKIKQGEVITHTFDFVNTGNAPLQISYANASCGCTVPTWPKAPIKPGGKGKITIEFNSKNKEGKLLKNVSIYANTMPEFNNITFNIEVTTK